MTRTLGTCSLCGGAVTCPVIWRGVYPPTPTCSSCGATAEAHGPVIPMRAAPRTDSTNTLRIEPRFEPWRNSIEWRGIAGNLS